MELWCGRDLSEVCVGGDQHSALAVGGSEHDLVSRCLDSEFPDVDGVVQLSVEDAGDRR